MQRKTKATAKRNDLATRADTTNDDNTKFDSAGSKVCRFNSQVFVPNHTPYVAQGERQGNAGRTGIQGIDGVMVTFSLLLTFSAP
jgi:hypothetical protein